MRFPTTLISAALVLFAAVSAHAGDAPADLAARVGELPNEFAKPGECGAFLFGKEERRGVLTVFSRADATVHFMADGKVLSLPRVGAGPELLFNQAEKMVFRGDGWAVQIEGAIKKPSKTMAGFMDVTLKLKNADGSNGELQLSGMIACRENLPVEAPKDGSSMAPPQNPPS